MKLRKCNSCEAIEEQSPFPTRGNLCKACVAVYQKEYRKRNAAQISANKSAWKLKNLDHVKVRDAKWAKNNPEKRRAARKAWVTRNPELDKQAKQTYVANNVDKVKAARQNWAKNNVHMRNAQFAKRRAIKRDSIPNWGNAFFVQEAYALAVLRTKVTKIKWEVDHIVPLVSKIVCGLHYEANLQVIPASINRKKSNRWWPDMPEV